MREPKKHAYVPPARLNGAPAGLRCLASQHDIGIEAAGLCTWCRSQSQFRFWACVHGRLVEGVGISLGATLGGWTLFWVRACHFSLNLCWANVGSRMHDGFDGWYR